ncbi:4-hydroxyphenylacetate 3-hydroxylase family protein [Desulfosporosinus hippei]|uniref:4-hydroxybutyryl-CoA dehydratase / vinylacetyl-CoA-Delta-isomerase n=1 Tax=Desulfosporosinus hippei DSM 8344 TaxID=1121419 RepID=A0A1G8I3I6_9FIRM|nr:4-hydroxyphenylacetate 3-hydroxylase N-terminal domain-containing protein [Desulfosporosinus hippei]SDI13545.1 4-hydroxybutyryl-CoA dehydratase / vinylacetyl-CoA-Delta-isomerase [Desulfosporosinus hippei DSM 8344]
MTLKTPQEYIDDIRNMKIDLYMFGEKIENYVDHPMVRPSLNAMALTYKLAMEPEYEDVMTATSNLTGQKVNRFTHLHQSTDDLVKKVKMQRLLGQKTGCCFQRCVGMDAFNAVFNTTFEIDAKHGTNYHKRFVEFLKYVQENDLAVDGCMTDSRGDRSKSPGEQVDPDAYVHIVSRNEEGIIVRGCKMHQTGLINSHEILVMPNNSLKENEKEWAVSFAIPLESPGIIYVYGRQSCDTRKLEGGSIDVGNQYFGGQEVMAIFNDVFVPWNRVFMDGETDFSTMLVERFASYHRQSYGGCKVGVGDALIGATQAMAEYNGVSKASHIKDKIVEMCHLNESLYSCGIACSAEGHKTASGNYLVDILLANICKQNVTRFPYEIARLAQDVAGGAFVTMPSEKDFDHSEVGALIKKYFIGKADVSAENRQRMLRLVENLTMGTAAVGYLTESMHGAGSPQAQRIMISRMINLAHRKNLAERLAGVQKNTDVDWQ